MTIPLHFLTIQLGSENAVIFGPVETFRWLVQASMPVCLAQRYGAQLRMLHLLSVLRQHASWQSIHIRSSDPFHATGLSVQKSDFQDPEMLIHPCRFLE